MSSLGLLYLCTGNSCRSQMAEAWTRHFYPDLSVASAGTAPGERVDPLAILVMKEVNVSIKDTKPKNIDQVIDSGFSVSHVITVCDSAAAECPSFSPHKENQRKVNIVHHSFDDPPKLARQMASEEEKLSVYRRVRDEIKTFVQQELTSILL